MMPHKSFHEAHVKAEQAKIHPGNNDGYVPHHPEPGHGDNPQARQGNSDLTGCSYDKTAHESDRETLGAPDDFRKMPHAHINSGVHSFHGASKVGGRLRNSGHKGAHRIGKR